MLVACLLWPSSSLLFHPSPPFSPSHFHSSSTHSLVHSQRISVALLCWSIYFSCFGCLFHLHFFLVGFLSLCVAFIFLLHFSWLFSRSPSFFLSFFLSFICSWPLVSSSSSSPSARQTSIQFPLCPLFFSASVLLCFALLCSALPLSVQPDCDFTSAAFQQ
jgi:hypothetical protein